MAGNVICLHKDIRTSGKLRFKCHDCGKWYNPKNVPDERYRTSTREAPKNQPKILVLDLETLPLLAYIWDVWNQNISMTMMDRDTKSKAIVTWSAKWLNDSKMMSDKMTVKEALKQDDRRIVESLWKLVDEADWLIAHNGIKYDIPVFNTRCLIHGISSPSPYKVIDTLMVARRQFALPHNKLEYIAQVLDIPVKMETGGFSLWRGCMLGDQKSLYHMQKYNDKDVLILEEVYLRLRGWIKNHPNFNLYTDKEGCCPTCGAEDTLKPNGKYRTTVNTYQSYKCSIKECSSFSRTGKSDNKTDIRSVAK